MTTPRDIRAMVTGLEKVMQSARSAKGAGDAAGIRSASSKLEKEVNDAKATSTLAKRSGVDAFRLESKIVAAKSLSDKLKSILNSDAAEADGSSSESRSSFKTRSQASISAFVPPEPPQPPPGSTFARAFARAVARVITHAPRRRRRGEHRLSSR